MSLEHAVSKATPVASKIDLSSRTSYSHELSSPQLRQEYHACSRIKCAESEWLLQRLLDKTALDILQPVQPREVCSQCIIKQESRGCLKEFGGQYSLIDPGGVEGSDH